MKKFIIIDHSLQDLQGHHYECSISIAEASQKFNYQPIIISNKNFSPSLHPQNIKIIPEFEVDWFNNSTKKLNYLEKKFKEFTSQWYDFNLVKFYQDFQNSFNYQLLKLKLLYPQSKILLDKIEGSLFRLNHWLKKDLSLIKFIPFINTLGGILKTIFSGIKFIFIIINKFTYKIWSKLFSFKDKTFQKSLKDIINKLKLSSEDHVFIHTLSIEQLEDILYLLQQYNIDELPQYHIMLRRDIDDPLVKNAKGIGIKGCLAQFYHSQLYPNKINFYTDTPQLIERYNSLSPVKFILIPVPFRQENLNLNQETKNKQEKTPLHLVYLGDARIEKGYLYLPQIIDDLWHDYLSINKLKFTIQSNFNITCGEEGILATRLRLEKYPEDKVKIIKNAMTTEEYYRLLMSADLLVIPYDVNSYRHRTSGVLTESLAAGKPVIVPSHTWLASQIDDTRGAIYYHSQDISATIIKVINNLNYYQKNAQEFSHNWRIQHSPANLITCLLSSHNFDNSSINIFQKNNFSVEKKPLFLIICNLDRLLKLDIDGQLTLSHIQYLSESNVRIAVIIYSLHREDDKEQQSTKINDLLSCYNIETRWFLTLNNKPKFREGLSREKFFQDTYINRRSFTRDVIDINSLSIPDSLTNYLQQQKFNSILLNSIIEQILVNNLGIKEVAIISQTLDLQSYKYAINYSEEINYQELETEFNLFKQISSLVSNKDYLIEKITKYNPDIKSYLLSDTYALISNNNKINYSKIVEYLWGNNKYNYYHLMDDILKVDRQLKVINKNGKKIAILYPWGDILERKAGASQRVGLLIDYLRENNHSVWLFTTGEEKELLNNNIRYSFYDQHFPFLDIVKKVYSNSYEGLINSGKIGSLEDTIITQNSDKIGGDWRLNMYYQYYCDEKFYDWINKITDWADIVMLEYPFWGKIVSKICREKQVKLIINAHDILCQQVERENPLYDILLAEEISSLKQGDIVVTVSPEDQQFLQTYNINSEVIGNPNNFDLSRQNIDSESQQKYFNLYPWLQENYCLFVGSGHFPNKEAVEEIKKIAFIYHKKKFYPSCKFVVIGSCCMEEKEDNFISLGKVESALLTLVYRQAKLILAPMLSGTGSSLKIAEGMSFSKVILGTNIAFRGYKIENKINGIIEDNIVLYPEMIERLLNNNDELNRIGKNAENFAKNYDYKVIYEEYLNLI